MSSNFEIKWRLFGDNLNESEKEFTPLIIKDCFLLFSKIFGLQVANNEQVIIYKDETAETPMLVTNQEDLLIRIASSNLMFWCQLIYQLSHELTHYISRQVNGISNSVSWFEETICEAMSLYTLDYFYENWETTNIGKNFPNFKSSVNQYLCDLLNKEDYGLYIDKIKTFKDLINFDKESQEKEGRDKRRHIVKQFYNLIKKHPEDIKTLINYKPHVDIIKKEIKKEEWVMNTQSEILKQVLEFTPEIENIS